MSASDSDSTYSDMSENSGEVVGSPLVQELDVDIIMSSDKNGSDDEAKAEAASKAILS